MKDQQGVYERTKGSGIWWIRYADTSGKERREKAGTKSSAKLLYQKRKQHVLEGRKIPEKLRVRSVSFNELIDMAVEHLDRQESSVIKKKSRRVELMRRGLGAMPAELITPQDISRWMAKVRREQEWMPATANRYKAFVSLAFRLGIENGKCTNNPARLVSRLREQNERTRCLSEEEEERLRKFIAEYCEGRQHDLNIALHTGMRQSEQYRLKWTDVDLVARQITIPKTKNYTKRHIPLNRVASASFQSLLESSGGFGRVFMNGTGSDPLLNPRYWWERVVEGAGLVDFHWHDLRHTFASRCVMSGVDLRTLQQLLGHKTLQMVVRYTHLTQSHELAAVEKLCA